MQAAISNFDQINSVSNCLSSPRRVNVFYNLNSRSNSARNLRNTDPKNLQNKINFKYVSEAELEAVVRRVRRAKQKKRDEDEWKNFLQQRQEKNNEETVEESICELSILREGNCCKECGLLAPAPNGSLQEEEHHASFQDTSKEDEDCITESNPGGAGVDDTVSHTYQLGPGLTKRLQDLLSTTSKMTSLLLNPCLNSQYEDEDVDRTIKRSVEFDAMFARNHLYEIQRLLKDTKQLAAAKSSNTAELEAKISAALKSVTQALQVYTRHVSKGSRIKYQQVVPIFQSITRIHSLLEQLTGQRLFPLRQEIEVSCSYMKQLLLEISVTETRSVSTVSHKPARARPTRHKPSADLSMYSRRHKADWRLKSANLARARFGAPGKKQVQPKEPTNAKELPFRNATRAVPEDHVTTMMEMIPNEKSPTRSKAGDRDKPESAKSSSREPRNVQLVCITEGIQKPNLKTSLSQEKSVSDSENIAVPEDNRYSLSIENDIRAESIEYHQKMVEYQKTNAHYKDGKALGIVDRLADRILTEMVLDFQQQEMNQVVQMLYNLEFE